MKPAVVIVFALALLVAVPAWADVTVFLDHSTASCPLYSEGPMTGAWYTNNCNPQGHWSSWTPPSGFTCISTTEVWHIYCIKGFCSTSYYVDFDSRTMTNTCSSFTSPQTYLRT